jgi:hypothetical protein
MKNSKRYHVVHIVNYLVLDGEQNQKIVFTGKDKNGADAYAWADVENRKTTPVKYF